MIQLIVTCLTIQSAHAQRIGHNDETWRIIRTPHFDVVVNTQQLDLGRYYARAAETAYSELSTVFDSMTERVVIVVNDTTDISNGYATRIPYPHIMAYSVQNGDHDWLAENGDWPQLLITHELTHISQFEPASGFYRFLRPVFGQIVAPNMLMPAWWKEGMAVEMETQFSTTGRSRSTFQDAALRAIVLENKLKKYDLPQANEVLPSWPYGVRPYLFGSMFFNQLVADTKSLKSINYLAARHGERVPYFLEEPIRELTGSNYETVYNRALLTAEQNAIQQVKSLKKVPLSEIRYVNKTSLASTRPTYSSTHGLLAYVETDEKDSHLIVTNAENGEKLDLKKTPRGTLQSIAFHPTEKKILYSKIDSVDSKYELSDLYEYDIDSGTSNQLTHSARARSASYSADGNQLVYLTTEGGLTQVRIMNRDTRDIKFVVASSYGTRYESPLFWDENTLLVSKMDGEGRYTLLKIDLTTMVEAPTELQARQLRFLKKVNNFLYFVSSKSGVNNLYYSEDLKTSHAVTNVSTGLWSYDINPTEPIAWVSLMTGQGFKVTQVKLKQIEGDLPAIQNKVSERYPTEYKAPSVDSADPLKDDEYEAGSYLWPSYWIPFIATSSSSRGIYIQAQTTGFDPLKKHQYAAVLGYDSELNKYQFSGNYINSVWATPFKLSSLGQSFALGDFRSIVETTTYAASVLPDMYEFNKKTLLEVGAEHQKVNYLQTTEHWGPYIQLSYLGFSKSIFQISAEDGLGATLKYEKLYLNRDETDGVARDYDKLQATAIGFFSKWLPDHHAVKARVSGLMTFQTVLARYGASSSIQFLEDDGLTPQYVVRGYAPAQFFGRNIWNANLEYRFPLTTVERGSGTDAYFLKRISGAVVTDALGVDGFGYAEDLTNQPLKSSQTIASSGVELKLESTIGYVLPLNFILGYYWPFSPQYASASSLGLSLQIGGLF